MKTNRTVLRRNLDPSLVWRFTRSFGGWTVIASYFRPLEFLFMQALCKYMYKTGVSRVQTICTRPNPMDCYFNCALPGYRNILIRYSEEFNKTEIIESNKFDMSNCIALTMRLHEIVTFGFD